jgi:hypothetical protein
MIRGYENPSGMVLFAPPNRRQRLSRRRFWTVTAIAAVAVAGLAFGQMSKPREVVAPSLAAAHGPMSYLPL